MGQTKTGTVITQISTLSSDESWYAHFNGVPGLDRHIKVAAWALRTVFGVPPAPDTQEIVGIVSALDGRGMIVAEDQPNFDHYHSRTGANPSLLTEGDLQVVLADLGMNHKKIRDLIRGKMVQLVIDSVASQLAEDLIASKNAGPLPL